MNVRNFRKQEYEIIIIGGGIGGLVCGCYLAKYGLKVLIVEKNTRVGGYCTSFEDNGYTFNACVRGFVGYGPGGIFHSIFTDLSLHDRISILRSAIYDEIKYQDLSFAIHKNPKDTIEELMSLFPAESKNIKAFFAFLLKENLFMEFCKYRKYCFQDFLNEYFHDEKLKFLFSILRIDSGEHPLNTSATADLALLRGNILDGGYFPKGGMSALPDCFLKCFKNLGGEILKGMLVKEIRVNKTKAIGVTLENGDFLYANCIVSNCDATLTYDKLLRNANINKNILQRINSMQPSISAFLMYLAIDIKLNKYFRNGCCSLWNFPKYLKKTDYHFTKEVDRESGGLICAIPTLNDLSLAPFGSESVTTYFGVPPKTPEFWERNKSAISKNFLERFFRIFPDARSHVVFTRSATPVDLENITLNRDGASRGWAPSKQQIHHLFPSERTPISNVFLVGHWVASYYGNGGVAFAAQSGKKVSTLIKKYLKKG